MPARNIIESILERNYKQKKVQITLSISEKTNDSIDRFIKTMAGEKAIIDKADLLEEWINKLDGTLKRISSERKKTKKPKAVANVKPNERTDSLFDKT